MQCLEKQHFFYLLGLSLVCSPCARCVQQNEPNSKDGMSKIFIIFRTVQIVGISKAPDGFTFNYLTDVILIEKAVLRMSLEVMPTANTSALAWFLWV